MRTPHHIKCMQFFSLKKEPSADECAALLWGMQAVCVFVFVCVWGGVQGAGCGHQLMLTPPFASSSLTDVTVGGFVWQAASWWSISKFRAATPSFSLSLWVCLGRL